MGNSHIQPISIEQSIDKRVKQRRQKKKQPDVNNVHQDPLLGLIQEEQLLFYHSSENADNDLQKLHTALGRINELKTQLDESESQRLDLQSRVEMLEDTTAYLNTESAVLKQKCSLPDTLDASQIYISELEKDLETAKQELTEIKLKSKKKHRMLTRQLNETKQKYSIQLFELRGELDTLKEENSSLKEKLTPYRHAKYDADTSSQQNRSKHDIILELSAQLSEQARKIEELEQTHPERNRISREHNRAGDETNTCDTQDRSSEQNSMSLPYNTEQVTDLVVDCGGAKNSSGEYMHSVGSSESPAPQKYRMQESEIQARSSRDSGLGSAEKHHTACDTTNNQFIPFASRRFDSGSDWESESNGSAKTFQDYKTKRKSGDAVAFMMCRTDSTTSEDELKFLADASQQVQKKDHFARNRCDNIPSNRFNIPSPTYAFGN